MTDPDYWYLSKGVDVRLSEHFRSHEFDCHCHLPECVQTVVKKSLVDQLEKIRWELSKYEKEIVKIVINDGNRCAPHNKDEGGALDSRHLPKHGDAADLGGIVKPAHIALVESIVGDRGGFHAYPWGVHVDERGHRSRWK